MFSFCVLQAIWFYFNIVSILGYLKQIDSLQYRNKISPPKNAFVLISLTSLLGSPKGKVSTKHCKQHHEYSEGESVR
jgi:hypothetical protein